MKKLLFAALLAILPFAAHAQTAQLATARVVATCGTPPATYGPGSALPITQDTTGKLCTSASAGGGASTTNAPVAPGAATATGAQMQKTFSPCLQSTAINTAIVATTTADATASAVDVNLAGFQGP